MPRSREEHFQRNNAFSLYDLYDLAQHKKHKKPWAGVMKFTILVESVFDIISID